MQISSDTSLRNMKIRVVEERNPITLMSNKVTSYEKMKVNLYQQLYYQFGLFTLYILYFLYFVDGASCNDSW
jgi:hypothetical protein